MNTLELAAVTKSFPGQRALDNVDFTVAKGEIHALLGHNGSGKSTLIKIMSGFYLPDGGPASYSVAGHSMKFGDGVGVGRAGVRFIHQDIGLLDDLTVLENLRLGSGTYDAGLLGRIRWGSERAAAVARLNDLGLDHIDPDAVVGRLSAVERTEVAIARALDVESAISVLVLDEATAALPSGQVEHLFALVRRLVARGVGVVYVTHRLEEVLAIADRVTVLRDGEVVLRSQVADLTQQSLARVIAGMDVGPVRDDDRAPREPGADPVLEFRDVHVGSELRGATFAVHPGEIVGVAGLSGSGVHEIVRLLEGSQGLGSGEVLLGGTPVRKFGARALRRHRAAVLPGERTRKRIVGMSVAENLTIGDLTPFWRGGFFRHRAERREATEAIRRFSILPGDPDQAIELLSGGNAQKVYVARWLRTNPQVLILEEPTHGVDVGGSADILRFVSEVAADHGVAVLLCSSDTDDLEATCDRVVILRDGVVAEQLTDREITRERIVELCYA
ncbi:sugar ABC transporter ATP-binding protein [Nocardioides marmoriginsengisoli]|uniref:Sugar ABC transporter ATP-binding protein n=1 Tax=Nocardioides marmoriginsengisoli TaxID=661483 RepID=A0A3N0CCY1_9ACTN|nr:sugar ABC transporter ATP-binding protein [Nocardioides marmoriginsengisoli]RNL61305.1 sugar ABC transporter ATP-binding protein [Nocardioides marmoriginsengisoli]